MKIRLSFPSKVEVEVGKSVDVKVQVSEVGPEPSYPDDTFWRHEDAKIDPRVFYIENQKRRHVGEKAWKPMSEEKGATWADVNALSEPKWKEFLGTMEEGKSIEKWPEEEEESNKITHSTSSISSIVKDCVENLHFNRIHTNDTRRMEAKDIINFLDRCYKLGVKPFPRIDRGGKVPEIMRAIKDYPDLWVVSDDESDSPNENVILNEQYKYFDQVKSVNSDIVVVRNWDGVNAALWEKYVPPKEELNQVCDIFLFTCYPYATHTTPEDWLKGERDRLLPYLPSGFPIIPVMQGFYGKDFTKPDLKYQWDSWKDLCSSYAIYLYRTDTPEYTGFEKGELREQVKKLNSQT